MTLASIGYSYQFQFNVNIHWKLQTLYEYFNTLHYTTALNESKIDWMQHHNGPKSGKGEIQGSQIVY